MQHNGGSIQLMRGCARLQAPVNADFVHTSALTGLAAEGSSGSDGSALHKVSRSLRAVDGTSIGAGWNRGGTRLEYGIMPLGGDAAAYAGPTCTVYESSLHVLEDETIR